MRAYVRGMLRQPLLQPHAGGVAADAEVREPGERIKAASMDHFDICQLRSNRAQSQPKKAPLSALFSRLRGQQFDHIRCNAGQLGLRESVARLNGHPFQHGLER